jgi:hypothetical protein
MQRLQSREATVTLLKIQSSASGVIFTLVRDSRTETGGVVRRDSNQGVKKDLTADKSLLLPTRSFVLSLSFSGEGRNNKGELPISVHEAPSCNPPRVEIAKSAAPRDVDDSGDCHQSPTACHLIWCSFVKL